MKAYFSNRAITSIYTDVMMNLEMKFETGGVLLGHYDGHNYYILENILPGNKAIHKEFCFEYDQEFVEYCASHISNLYNNSLEVIGLWHTHIDAPCVFSIPDKVMNEKYVKTYGHSIISGILACKMKKISDFKLFNIGEDFSEFAIDSIWGDKSIPSEYLVFRMHNNT